MMSARLYSPQQTCVSVVDGRTAAGRRSQVSVAVASGLILSETSPAEESQNEAGQSHENGHADTQSDDRWHIGFQPRSVRF
jgi:hypothetical protein